MNPTIDRKYINSLEARDRQLSNRNSWLLTTPSIIWLTVFFSIPYLIVLIYSLLTPDIYDIKFEFSFAAYKDILQGVYFKPFFLSFRLALVTTFLCLLLGYPAAYYIARSTEKTKNLL